MAVEEFWLVAGTPTRPPARAPDPFRTESLPSFPLPEKFWLVAYIPPGLSARAPEPLRAEPLRSSPLVEVSWPVADRPPFPSALEPFRSFAAEPLRSSALIEEFWPVADSLPSPAWPLRSLQLVEDFWLVADVPPRPFALGAEPFRLFAGVLSWLFGRLPVRWSFAGVEGLGTCVPLRWVPLDRPLRPGSSRSVFRVG